MVARGRRTSTPYDAGTSCGTLPVGSRRGPEPGARRPRGTPRADRSRPMTDLSAWLPRGVAAMTAWQDQYGAFEHAPEPRRRRRGAGRGVRAARRAAARQLPVRAPALRRPDAQAAAPRGRARLHHRDAREPQQPRARRRPGDRRDGEGGGRAARRRCSACRSTWATSPPAAPSPTSRRCGSPASRTPARRSPSAPTPTTRTPACARCSASRACRAQRRRRAHGPRPPRASCSPPVASARSSPPSAPPASARSTRVPGIVELARAAGARVHVDTAYGGFFALVADDSADGVAAAPYRAIARRRQRRGRPAQARAAALRLRGGAVRRPVGGPLLRPRLAVHLLQLRRAAPRRDLARVQPRGRSGGGAVAHARGAAAHRRRARPGAARRTPRRARSGPTCSTRSDALAAYQAARARHRHLPAPAYDDVGVDASLERALPRRGAGDPAEQIHLATYTVTGAALAARGHAVQADRTAARILRSTVMKPESETYVAAHPRPPRGARPRALSAVRSGRRARVRRSTARTRGNQARFRGFRRWSGPGDRRAPDASAQRARPATRVSAAAYGSARPPTTRAASASRRASPRRSPMRARSMPNAIASISTAARARRRASSCAGAREPRTGVEEPRRRPRRCPRRAPRRS